MPGISSKQSLINSSYDYYDVRLSSTSIYKNIDSNKKDDFLN